MKKLFLIILSFFLSILAAEVFVRIFFPQDLSGSWLEYKERGYQVNRANWTARHQKLGRSVTYRFNDLHLRNDALLPEAKKVLILGESFTFGWLLDREDTVAHHLQTYADAAFGKNTFQFLNAAVGGWGTADEMAFLEDMGDRIKPEIVVVFLSYKDIERSLHSGLYSLKDKASLDLTLSNAQIQKSRIKTVLDRSKLYHWSIQNIHLIQVARKALIRAWLKWQQRGKKRVTGTTTVYDSSDTEPREAGLYLGQALFKRMKNWCDKRGVKLYVTETGWPWGRGWWSYTEYFLDRSQEFFEKKEIPYFDPTSFISRDLKGQFQSYFIPGDFHPNEKGSALIAKHVWRWLKPRLSVQAPTNLERKPRAGRDGGYVPVPQSS